MTPAKPTLADLLEHGGKFPKHRISLVTDGQTRPLFWFDPDGDDLYWGPSTPGKFVSVPADPGPDGKVTITIPEDWSDLPTLTTKLSHHASGQVHLKAGGQIIGEAGKLPKLDDLAAPLTIGALITKRADQYPVTTKSDERGGATALRIHLDGQDVQRRLYLDFVVTPAGTFDLPPTVLRMGGDIPIVGTRTLGASAILVVRAVGMPEDPAEWHPDKELWFQRFQAEETPTASLDDG
jgi:hypothetical protein